MDDKAVEEATRLGLLERLEARPASIQELARRVLSLGIAERVVGGLVERLAGQGVVEELPGGDVGPSPTYRLAQQQQQRQQRRHRGGGGGSQPRGPRSGGLHSPTAAHQGMQQPAYVGGMVPVGFSPYAGQQVLYYPAGPATYQQAPMGPGSPWHRSPVAGGQRQAALQSAGSGGGQGMGVGAVGVGPQGMAAYHPMQPFYFAAAAPVASPPLTPTLSGGVPRPPMPRAGSSGSASAGSTGWAGVPLSQSAADVAAAAGAGPSPRSQASPRSQQSQQEPSPAAGGHEAPAACSAGPPSSAAEGGRRAGPPRISVQPPASLPGSEAHSLEDGSGSEEGGEAAPAAPPSGASSSGGEGGGERGGAASSAGSSGGSRRGRAARERQPCAFFLKTGTCAYGDSCKFAHPFDRAPRVEFNSLGLPLRPGEPECSFFMKNFRCAFGHTCKFHHPELPPGVAQPSGSAMPAMYAVQYAVQYQPTAPPLVSSVLGLKGGAGGSPGTPLGASPASPGAFYLAPHPFAGMAHGYSARPGMTMPFPLPMMGGASLHRTSPHRSNSLGNGSNASGRAVAAAAAAAAQQQPAAHAPAAVVSGTAAEGDGGPASVAESPRAPQPIMVFSRRQNSDPGGDLSSRLDQLQLAGFSVPQHAQQVPVTSGPASGDGVPRSPQPDVVATA